MSHRVFNILFLCKGNSARSIIAEAYLNSLKLPHLRAFSAGSVPLGHVHPMALTVLRDVKIATEALRSKSWDEFAQPDSPKMDMVINLCEDPAAETCPKWPGKPALANWGIPDPAAVEGSDTQMRNAFGSVLTNIKQRADFLQHFDEAQLANLSKHAAASGKSSASKSASENRQH